MKKSDNKLKYTRYKFATKIRVDTAKKKEIIINPPNMCPICGSTDASKEVKLFSGRSKYIKILYCKEHYDMIKKSSAFFLAKCTISITLITIGLMLLTFFLTSFILISLIIFLIGIIYFFYEVLRSISFKLSTDGYIYFYYYKDSSIVSIRRSSWAKAFKKLNDCTEDKFDLNIYEDLEKKASKNMKYFCIIFALFLIYLIFFVLMLSFGVVHLEVLYIILWIWAVLLIYFGGKAVNYISKQEKMKRSKYT